MQKISILQRHSNPFTTYNQNKLIIKTEYSEKARINRLFKKLFTCTKRKYLLILFVVCFKQKNKVKIIIKIFFLPSAKIWKCDDRNRRKRLNIFFSEITVLLKCNVRKIKALSAYGLRIRAHFVRLIKIKQKIVFSLLLLYIFLVIRIAEWER